MSNIQPNINFEVEVSEEKLIEEFKSGFLKDTVDSGATFLVKKTVKAFEKLYTMVDVEPPSWNATAIETIDMLYKELQQRNYVDIGIENKSIFLIHLFANSIDTIERTKQLLNELKIEDQKKMLGNLVDGVGDDNPAVRIDKLKSYFNVFPSSNHFTANLIYAELLLNSGSLRLAKMYAERAYHAVPYNLRVINLINKINASDSNAKLIKKIFNA